MNSFEEFNRCLLCGSNALIPMKGYENTFLVRCSSCRFVFCKRKPTNDELKVHYASYPRTNAISEITVRRYDALLDTFEPYRKTNNIIDVGCGDGFFLEAAKKRKWNVFGTEFSQEAIDACIKRGIQITASPLDPNHYKRDFFDVITSFEVIEHINSPQNELKSFRSILRTGGVVYLTTPNFNSISRNFLKSKWNIISYPDHLSYYTRSTLKSLFKKSDFKLIKISTSNISIKRFIASTSSAEFSSTKSNVDELLRQKTEGNIVFKVLKTSVNAILNLTGKGDAMKALFQKL